MAVLDVLGFSERVYRESDVGLDAYIDTVVEVTRHYAGMSTILFSDTVVVFTYDDSPHSFGNVTSAISRLSFALLAEEVPIRGAIAHGAFVRSEHDGHGTVIAGRPIIEAHHFESQLQWIGVMLTPSTLKHVGDGLDQRTAVTSRAENEPDGVFFERSLKAARIQPWDRIPVEPYAGGGSGRLQGYGVVPIAKDVTSVLEIRKSVKAAVDKLGWLKQLAPDPRSQTKYQNSIDWLSAIHTDWISKLR